jgi:hypothetical protein
MTVNQIMSYLPIIIIVGISVLAPILRKAAEMRELRQREQAQDDQREQAIRMGQDVHREDAMDSPARADASTQASPRTQRGSIADELAKRRQQALEQLRKRQQGQTQARTGAQPTQTRTAPPPRGPMTATSSAPTPARRRIQGQQPPRRSQSQPVETPEIQAARQEIAAARAHAPKREGRGLNVRLDTIDPHYVREEASTGIEALHFDVQSIRQALVMAELLAPPIALRGPDRTSIIGPIGVNT